MLAEPAYSGKRIVVRDPRQAGQASGVDPPFEVSGRLQVFAVDRVAAWTALLPRPDPVRPVRGVREVECEASPDEVEGFGTRRVRRIGLSGHRQRNDCPHARFSLTL